MKTFPVMWPHRRAEIDQYRNHACPRSVPWELLAPHEAQAQSNHSQDLARLAERGGLAPCEMVAVLLDRSHQRMAAPTAIAELLRLIEERTT